VPKPPRVVLLEQRFSVLSKSMIAPPGIPQPLYNQARHIVETESTVRTRNCRLTRRRHRDFIRTVSHIHFIGGEKGGVGKSVVARVLAQWFIDHAQPLAAVDADQSHGVLLRFYGEYSQPVDLSQPDSADQIMDRALGADRVVLVDLPGQSIRALYAWLDGADVFSFARDMGVGLSFWHVTDGSYASVCEIAELVELLGDRVHHIAVKNHGRARDFSQFDQSEARRRLDAVGAATIDLPELDAATMFRIDQLGASFWAAANATEGDLAMRPLERQRVRLWLVRAYEPLATLTIRAPNQEAGHG
jgi:hypothetical protein